MKQLILIGAGGHAKVVIHILRRRGMTITAAVDADASLHGQTFASVPVIGGDAEILKIPAADVLLINAIGNGGAAIGDSGLAVRRTVYESFVARGYQFASIISPNAIIASNARLGDGCHVIAGAILQPGVTVGANAIVNTGACVDHDCKIGAHSHIAPGVTLCGAVTVGESAHVGAGAVVVQGLTIGNGAVIGAGAVVTTDVAPGATVFGVPARPVERH